MSYATFEECLQQHIEKYGVPAQVSLQGEGEPTLHRDFFRMAERVRELGSRPYTITNGTYKHGERFIGLFPSIGVSIDSLDANQAESIGRFNLPRVLEFIEALRNHVRIIVHTVAVSTDIQAIANWCRNRKLEHQIQALQTKSDYRYRYAERAVSVQSINARFNCPYLAQPFMRYYSVEGAELPCCFIKDMKSFPGMDAMYDHQRRGTLLPCCQGCRYAGWSTKPDPIITRSD